MIDLAAILRRFFAARRRLHLSSRVDVVVATLYYAECYDCFGRLKWQVDGHNIVVTAGRNKLLDATFKTGLTTPAWYGLLKGTGSVVAGDTLASHGGWSELNSYSGNRPAFTPGTISNGSVDNSASKCVFSITGTMDVYGAGLCDAQTGTSGTLYGAGDFATNRAVISGDTLNVTLTPSVTAA